MIVMRSLRGVCGKRLFAETVWGRPKGLVEREWCEDGAFGMDVSR